MADMPVALFSSLSSDIGLELARRYRRDGWLVAGTYRSSDSLPALREVAGRNLWHCDLNDVESVDAAAAAVRATGLRWNTFVSCASQPQPLTAFFDTPFDGWSQSIHVNAIEQLRFLHAVHGCRVSESVCDVVFFAGPGTNSAVVNFSALTIGKMMLIKMCELLDAECPDLNAFIIGPGWTRTKTHATIINDPDVSPEKRRETAAFLERETGTSFDDIYDCIRWLSAGGRERAGGRNFSVVHDLWGDERLAAALASTPSMYKFRRSGNDWADKETQRHESP
jgi:NAD(P)-dependent dehydrogenase (short-subunit alcohol dehydrogenase family)